MEAFGRAGLAELEEVASALNIGATQAGIELKEPRVGPEMENQVGLLCELGPGGAIQAKAREIQIALNPRAARKQRSGVKALALESREKPLLRSGWIVAHEANNRA